MKSFWTIAALVCSASLANAQRAPRPASTPAAPSPAPVVQPRVYVVEPALPTLPGEPVIAIEPMVAIEPSPAVAPLAIEFPFAFTPAPAVAVSPVIEMPSIVDLQSPLVPMTTPTPMIWDAFPAQGPTSPRAPAVDRALEAELRRLTSEIERAERANQRALEAQDRALQRESEAMLRNLEREREMQERQIERQLAQSLRESQLHARVDVAHMAQSFNNMHLSNFSVTVPSGWAKQDIADSVWNRARELLNRGEWGEAVSAFRSIPQRYPNSAYSAQAMYYQAFGLFRIGGTNELREALQVLEAAKTKYPNAGRSNSEIASLATRIRGVLANRGDAQAAAELRAMSTEQAATCDREEQSVQAEAMNQLSRMEGSNINDLISRVLARKDECAIQLRRTAVFLVGNRRDAQAVSILAGVARSDPSVDVRVEAITVIGRLPNEEGVTVLEELVRADDERVQRAAIRALVRHQSARAKTSVRSLVERDDVSERVRSEALSAFNSEQATADDITWLRALYSRMTTPTLKARTLSAIVRVGGPEVDQWLVTIARDDAQPSEIRATAMRRIGQTMSIADLGRLYDTATNRRFRSEVIGVLGKRTEEAATDKLIDIVKNGTDPQLRSSAISAITEKKDAKAMQALLEIINKTPSRGN